MCIVDSVAFLELAAIFCPMLGTICVGSIDYESGFKYQS